MESKTFTIPNINCGHCTHAVKMEVGEIPGVQSVSAEAATKEVTVQWEAPATWDKIEEVLVDINYAPA